MKLTLLLKMWRIGHIEQDMYYDLWDLGEDIFTNWHDIDEYYVLVPNLPITKQIKELAEKGFLGDAPYKLGTSIGKILEESPQHSNEAYHLGSNFYTFPGGFSYFIDELTREITTIYMSGARLTATISEIEAVLGKPEVNEYSEYDDSYYHLYKFGDYTLKIDSMDNEHVFEFFLGEWHEE